jgi:alpha-methylacyl-CoA racemase
MATGGWQEGLERNVLDGAYPLYDLYLTADDEYVAVGALEPRFRQALLDQLGLWSEFPGEIDRSEWPRLRQRLTEVFGSKTREEWAALAGDSQLALSPVHSFSDAPANPHNRERGDVRGGGRSSPPSSGSALQSHTRRDPDRRPPSRCRRG